MKNKLIFTFLAWLSLSANAQQVTFRGVIWRPLRPSRSVSYGFQYQEVVDN